MKKFYTSRYFPPVFFILLNLFFFYPFFLSSKIPLDANPLYRTYPWRAYATNQTIHDVNPVRYFHQIDSTLMIYPLREEVRAQLLSGKIPLWTDLVFCGAPLLANQVGAFDFMSLPLLPFSAFRAFGLQIILQLILAGWFMFLFCELIGLARAPSLFAGVAFMWNGFFFRNLAVISVIGTLCWLPLLLYFVHQLYRTKSWKAFHGLTFVIMAQFYGGYAQYWIYNLGLTGSYFVYLFLKERTFRFQFFIKTVTALSLAILLSLPQIIPFYQALKDSPRTDPTTNKMYEGRNHVSPRKIITLAIPDFYGNTDLNLFSRILLKPPLDTSDHLWIRVLFGETPSLYNRIWAYAGLITLLLALLTLRIRAARFWIFFACMPLIFLILLNFSLPRSAIRMLWEGFDRMDHTRSMILVALSISILGGYGLQSILENKTLALRFGKVLVITTLCLLIIFGTLFGILKSSSDSIIKSGKQYYEANREASPFKENTQAFALEGIHSVPKMIQESFRILILPFVFVILFAMLTVLFGKDVISIQFFAISILLLSAFDLSYRGRFDPPIYFSKEAVLYPKSVRPLQFLKDQIDDSRVMEIQRKLQAPKLPLKSYSDLIQFRTRGFNFFDFQSFDFVARPNSLIHDQISSAGGYLSIYPAAIRNLWNARANDNLQFVFPGEAIDKWSGSLIDVQSIRYILADPGSKSTIYPLVYNGPDLAIFENKDALPRTYVVNEVQSISSTDETLKLLKSNGFYPKKMVLLNQPVSLQGAKLPFEWKAEIQKTDPGYVQVAVETNQDSILVLTDTFNDGWNVTVDKKTAQIYRANYAFLGVRLSPGSHTVIFRYFPREFTISLIISAFAIVCWLALMVVARRYKKPGATS